MRAGGRAGGCDGRRDGMVVVYLSLLDVQVK